MPGKAHSAIERYKAKRKGQMVPDLTREEREAVQRVLNPALEAVARHGERAISNQSAQARSRRTRSSKKTSVVGRVALLGFLLLASAAAVAWRMLPVTSAPIQLAYEIDLSRAPAGALTITLMAEGKLPEQFEIKSAPGLAANPEAEVFISPPQAYELKGDGGAGPPLAVSNLTDGWAIDTGGARRIAISYDVDLSRAAGSEEDIRQHISTPVAGGIRAAGYEVFLLPANARVDDITVMIHNPADLAVLVPWPALVRGIDRPEPLTAESSTLVEDNVQPAHLGYGQGFRPVELESDSRPKSIKPLAGMTSPVPANLFYHPKDLADLNNALIIAGDIRTSSVQTRGCVIQLATDQDWEFRDDAALDLIRRIARTELGFFGSAPTEQITVLLSANRVTAKTGFDVYGVHTGSSVLILMSPETTYGELEEQIASVIAHEMFHGWLGESLRQTDPQTLWFTEGVTTWYAARMLIAAGLWSPDHARRILIARLERDYQDNELLGTMSLAEAAAEVMAESNQVRLAYAGGVAANMALDQWLAAASGLERPLDEVLRHLYDNYQGQDLSREMIEEAIYAVTGVDCHDWLETHIYGRTALPPLAQLI